MTKDQVLARKATLELERDQIKASLVLYEGALQDCDYWLKTIEENTPIENTDVDG